MTHTLTLALSAAGVGYLMVQAQLNLNTPTVMAGMVAIGLVGVAIDVALRTLENRINRHWGRES